MFRKQSFYGVCIWMVKHYLLKVLLTIFCIVFLNVNELYSFDKIKLRFKNINIENSIRKQNQDVYSKKLVNFLNSYFSDKGQMKNFVLNVSLDKYNVIVRKPNEQEKDKSFFNKKEARIYLHKTIVSFEARDMSKKKLIASSELKISEFKKINKFVGLKERKKINSELSKMIEKTLGKELRRILLLKLGDFIIPN